MKVQEIEGFDYDYLGNWEYLNKEIAIAIDEADMFTYLRSLYVIEGMKIILEKKSDSDFWDLYTSVADNVATEIQNGRHTGILEAVMSTATFYKCVKEYYTSDILYCSDDKHTTISTIALKALSDALYEMILLNSVSNYLNMELAKAIYKKWHGNTDNFPYEEVAEYLKNNPAYTEVKIGEYVQNLKKIFTKKITITVDVPSNFSTEGLQSILEKYFHGNIEIAEN